MFNINILFIIYFFFFIDKSNKNKAENYGKDPVLEYVKGGSSSVKSTSSHTHEVCSPKPRKLKDFSDLELSPSHVRKQLPIDTERSKREASEKNKEK